MPSRRNTNQLFSLSEAAWQFAPRRLKDSLNQARSNPSSPSKPLSKPEGLTDAIAAFGEALQTFTQDLKAQNEPLWEMQKYLLQQIASEKLEAFGVMIKPEIGRDMQRVPPFIFDNSPKINWNKNSVENVGHRFEGIKVRRVGRRPNEKSLSNIGFQKELGRPTKIAQINKAIDGLIANGADLQNIPRQKACKQIRQYAHKKCGANIEIGFSDPVIQRALFRRFGKRE